MRSGGYAVILAGGRGERFWPLSTSRRPKHFLSLVGRATLLAQAVERLDGLLPREHVFVITGRELAAATREAVPSVPAGNIIGEPVGRDTAAAVALAAALVKSRDPAGVFCILTADHVIDEVPRFHDTLRAAMDLAAARDVLVTLGIRPERPSTAYGYIEVSPEEEVHGGIPFHAAHRFVEKPDRETALGYLRQGNFYWNAGMFIWSVPSLERALRTHCPRLAGLIERLGPFIAAGNLGAALDAEYPGLERISVDYALMEKADNVIMARGTFGWDDVGSWPALARHLPPDEWGNVARGQCEAIDSVGNIVVSGDRLTALVGVTDLVVVQADGVTLVCAKDRAQDLKALLARLRARGTYDEVL